MEERDGPAARRAASQTIETLGLTPGRYVFGSPADTITVNIGATTAVPEAGT